MLTSNRCFVSLLSGTELWSCRNRSLFFIHFLNYSFYSGLCSCHWTKHGAHLGLVASPPQGNTYRMTSLESEDQINVFELWWDDGVLTQSSNNCDTVHTVDHLPPQPHLVCLQITRSVVQFLAPPFYILKPKFCPTHPSHCECACVNIRYKK